MNLDQSITLADWGEAATVGEFPQKPELQEALFFCKRVLPLNVSVELGLLQYLVVGKRTKLYWTSARPCLVLSRIYQSLQSLRCWVYGSGGGPGYPF